MKQTNIAALRENYTQQSLDLSAVADTPFTQFEQWFDEAMKCGIKEPNAMTLATATADGFPSARIVLLKGFSTEGFVFFTNYESRKGTELAQNPHAALLFNWLELERQVRIEGVVSKISIAESEAYFQSRPKGSQIGAWVSPQSQVISDRKVLEDRENALTDQYKDQDTLPLPPFWGGYCVRPSRVEFWQGRPSRLHDRIAYQWQENEGWQIVRLAP